MYIYIHTYTYIYRSVEYAVAWLHLQRAADLPHTGGQHTENGDDNSTDAWRQLRCRGLYRYADVC